MTTTEDLIVVYRLRGRGVRKNEKAWTMVGMGGAADLISGTHGSILQPSRPQRCTTLLSASSVMRPDERVSKGGPAPRRALYYRRSTLQARAKHGRRGWKMTAVHQSQGASEKEKEGYLDDRVNSAAVARPHPPLSRCRNEYRSTRLKASREPLSDKFPFLALCHYPRLRFSLHPRLNYRSPFSLSVAC